MSVEGCLNAEFGGEKDVLALLRIGGKPFTKEILGVAVVVS